MTPRHRARQIALQILYLFDINLNAKGEPLPKPEDLSKSIEQHFDHFKTPDALRGFTAELIAGTLKHLEEFDPLLEKFTENWKINRLGFVDRNILRMALFEMKYVKDIPKAVTINESVELAKEFGTKDSPKFINGVLDSIQKTIS